MRGRPGFTLIEVVVAGGLLAIGITGFVGLQAQALQAQRRVAVVRQLVAVAEAEIDRQLALPVPSSGSCHGPGVAAVASCVVEVEGCHLSQAGLCAMSDSVRARRMVVRTASGSGQEFVLSAIHTRFPGP